MGWGTEIVFNTSVRHTGPHSLEFKHTGGDAYLDSEPIPIGSDYGAESGRYRAPTPVQYGLVAKAATGGDKIVVEVYGSADWPQGSSWVLINQVTFGLGTAWREIRRNPAGNTIGYNWLKLRIWRPTSSLPGGVGANVASVYVDKAWIAQIEPLARLYMTGNQTVNAGANPAWTWTNAALFTPSTTGWAAPPGSQILTSPSITIPFLGDVRLGQAGLYQIGAYVNVQRNPIGGGTSRYKARIYDVTNALVISEAGPFVCISGQSLAIPVSPAIWDVMNPAYTGTDAERRIALQVAADDNAGANVDYTILGGVDYSAMSLMRIGGRP